MGARGDGVTGMHMTDWSPTPYPGRRPATSVAIDPAGVVHRLAPDPRQPGRWLVGESDADAWLARWGAAPLAARAALLSYGSNASPGKVAQMSDPRDARLPLPVILMRARVSGLSAVWSDGRRVRDGAVPATIVAEPDATESMAVMMVAPDQWPALDTVEGRSVGAPSRYGLMRIHAGDIVLDGGAQVRRPWAYVGRMPQRLPWVDGHGRPRPVFAGDPPRDVPSGRTPPAHLLPEEMGVWVADHLRPAADA
jgi:hypothetical protein